MLLLLKAWSVIRNVTGYIIDLFTRYPLQFILVLVCCYAFWQKTRYDAIVSDYAEFRSSVQYQADMQKAKNEILRKQDEAAMNDVIAKHKQQLADAELNRKREADKLKGSINEISDALNIYRDAVSLRNKSNNTLQLPKVAENTAGLTETERNCYAHLTTVIDACKVTDYDYEALYNLYKRQCDIYGCE